jgi:hypothetical protein
LYIKVNHGKTDFFHHIGDCGAGDRVPDPASQQPPVHLPTHGKDKNHPSAGSAAFFQSHCHAILGVVWVLDLRHIEIAAFPFWGPSALLIGGLAAFWASKAFKMRPQQTGSYVVCGGFTNIGSLGALFCFMFLGEAGFALVPFYKLFEETPYFSVGFPLAKSYGTDYSDTPGFFQRIRSAVMDPFVLVAVSSILTGLCLILAGAHRPQLYSSINSIFIPLASFLLLASIGMVMRFSSLGRYWKPGLVIGGIKVVLVPLVIVGAGFFLGLHELDGGLPLKVVWILSSMPVGFIAMVPPSLYNLDTDLANACWLISNTILFFQIPLFFFI